MTCDAKACDLRYCQAGETTVKDSCFWAERSICSPTNRLGGHCKGDVGQATSEGH
ncbi:hypothetical protein J1N35_008988 [Gossypium stocksii]|uniref:Uncharacterized protein n=1 Tax=Gossypium stocksii TaxID=47602 RepID=A0A9D3WBA2_9ROSI|nr:hypothetical protein J1N35_008988 [Gossypium stocksii]